MAATAGGRGRLRASHADREQVIDVLKAAFVHGRLTKDEFDVRVGQAFAARTYAELAAVTADIPAGPVATRRPRPPARAQAQLRVIVPVIFAATVATAGLWAALLLAHVDSEAVNSLMAGFACACLGALILAASVMLESRRQKRPGVPDSSMHLR